MCCCMSAAGELYFIDDIIISEIYWSKLKTKMLPSLFGRCVLFQHDKDPINLSSDVSNALLNNVLF